MNELEPPLGWTVTHERRQVATEDGASAFTDGYQWTVRDPAGNRPPQAEWPTAWRRQAVLYAHMMATRDPDAEPPPYASSPSTLDMLPRQEREPVGVEFLRKWQLAGEAVHPVPVQLERDVPGVVLHNRSVDTIAELVALCSPAKAALGVTLKTPAGRVGKGWRWGAAHGAGIDPTTGIIRESVALRLERDGDDRSALFLWARPVPNPVLVLALTDSFGIVGGLRPWAVAAVLAQLPTSGWEKVLSTTWNRGPTGRPDDIPRAESSAAVQKEVQS